MWRVDDVVEVNYLGKGKWFKAVISKVGLDEGKNKNRVKVRWEDGQITVVSFRNLRRQDSTAAKKQ